jgi:hypothetical protein
MHLLLVVRHACFHQQPAYFVLHLHRLPHQQMAVAQYPPSVPNLARCHMAFRKVVAAQ